MSGKRSSGQCGTDTQIQDQHIEKSRAPILEKYNLSPRIRYFPCTKRVAIYIFFKNYEEKLEKGKIIELMIIEIYSKIVPGIILKYLFHLSPLEIY